MTLLPLDAADQAAAPTPPLAEGAPAGRGARVPGFLRRPGGLFGAGWLLLLLVASLTAPLWRPYPVDEQDLAHPFALPSSAHWFGTDPLGRDIFSRVVTAGAQPLIGSAITVLVAFGIGLPLALVAADRGRRTERAVSRLTEVFLALPVTVLLLALIGVIGSRTNVVMAVLGVLFSAALYRIMLGVAQSVRQRPYVDAARVNGLGTVRVSLVHVLPSMATVAAVQAAQLFGIGLLMNAGLAFLGFGPSEPTPSWGFLIQDASQHIYDAPWLLVPTGLMLSLTVVAANALADALAPRTGTERSPAPRSRRRGAPDPARTPAASFPAGEDAALVVRDLRVATDGGTELVTGVSFTVPPGRVLGLVGESGCGKTVTARSLTGLLADGLAVSAGHILWQGRDLAGLDERELNDVRGREIAMVSQEPTVALDPMFSIASQLTAPIRRFSGVGRAEARRMAAELLRQVGIPDVKRVLRSYPHQVSGGMAQRVAIALALTGSPRLLIADEPTTALDVTVQAEILGLLRRLVQETGLSVLIVSHDLGVVADLCDDVAVMYAGQIVEAGTAAGVLDSPAHPYTMALLAANPHLPEGVPVPSRLASVPGRVPSPGSWPTGCRFAGRCQFVQDSCRKPFEAATAHEGGAVLCVRAEDLASAGLWWDGTPAPITSGEAARSADTVQPAEHPGAVS